MVWIKCTETAPHDTPNIMRDRDMNFKVAMELSQAFANTKCHNKGMNKGMNISVLVLVLVVVLVEPQSGDIDRFGGPQSGYINTFSGTQSGLIDIFS